MEPLSASGLAELAGATEAEVEHMIDLGILVPCDGAAPFLATDVQKIRLAKACEEAGVSLDPLVEGMRRVANVENEAYHARFELPVLESGAHQRTAMELASRMSGDFNPLVDRALMGIYRRQQELAWTEHLVEHIETELEAAAVRSGCWKPAMDEVPQSAPPALA
jgi:hypothetical protein